MLVNAAFPEKALVLLDPAPYKVFYGGRGGSKTWDFCRALLILGVRRKLFILCAREIQKSIAESTHRTLAEQIAELKLQDFYQVLSHKIIGANGTQFVFAGIRNNITAIKSMESIDICAVFEATFVSEHSWNVLLPTIRRDPPHGPFERGSEIWIEFNPELASDYTYRFWVLEPPEGTKVVRINWHDNPWFPEVLLKQKEDLRKRDHDAYLTVWEGQTRRVLKGAIYARELELAGKERRISPNIAVDRAKPVNVSVDLGRADTTSLWFSQQVGTEHRFVDYYGNFGFDWGHYLDVMQTGIGEDDIEKRRRRYQIGTIYLPHDAASAHVAASKTIARQTRDAYPGDGRVQVVPRTDNVVNDINSVRMMFSRMYFNEKNCADGLTALAHYRYEVDPETKEVSLTPLHDWSSHPADALRCYVMGLKSDGNKPRPQEHVPRVLPSRGDRLGWLAS